jgi:hypothetical protein
MPPELRFTEYALFRMHQRDISEEDVRDLFESRRTQHKARRDGRIEARSTRLKTTLLVIYRRNGGITVINAMWE